MATCNMPMPGTATVSKFVFLFVSLKCVGFETCSLLHQLMSRGWHHEHELTCAV